MFSTSPFFRMIPSFFVDFKQKVFCSDLLSLFVLYQMDATGLAH